MPPASASWGGDGNLGRAGGHPRAPCGWGRRGSLGQSGGLNADVLSPAPVTSLGAAQSPWVPSWPRPSPWLGHAHPHTHEEVAAARDLASPWVPRVGGHQPPVMALGWGSALGSCAGCCGYPRGQGGGLCSLHPQGGQPRALGAGSSRLWPRSPACTPLALRSHRGDAGGPGPAKPAGSSHTLAAGRLRAWREPLWVPAPGKGQGRSPEATAEPASKCCDF